MKCEYRMIFDTGKVFTVIAKSRGKAIEAFCKEIGASKEWVNTHCVVRNMGRVK